MKNADSFLPVHRPKQKDQEGKTYCGGYKRLQVLMIEKTTYHVRLMFSFEAAPFFDPNALALSDRCP